jgi:hypothetical protein
MAASSKRSLREQLADLTPIAQCGLIAGALFVAWLAASVVAYAIIGIAGPLAAAVAAGLCLVGALVGLALANLFHGPSAVVYSLVVGMLARTLVPLAGGIVLARGVPWLAECGLIYYLLVFYIIALATETVLLVAKVPSSTAPGKAV